MVQIRQQFEPKIMGLQTSRQTKEKRSGHSPPRTFDKEIMKRTGGAEVNLVQRTKSEFRHVERYESSGAEQKRSRTRIKHRSG